MSTQLLLASALSAGNPLQARFSSLRDLFADMHHKFLTNNEQSLALYYIDIRSHPHKTDTVRHEFLIELSAVPDHLMGQMAAINALEIVDTEQTLSVYKQAYQAYLTLLQKTSFLPTDNEEADVFLALGQMSFRYICPEQLHELLA